MPSAQESDALGPISYVIVEFPGAKMTGEGLAELLSLVDQGVVRILDLQFVLARPTVRSRRWSSTPSISTGRST